MRPGTSVPLTFEEHRELAAELRATRARLRQLCELVVSVYGGQNPAAFTFQRSIEQLDRLVQEMRAQAGADLPGQPVDQLYQ